MKPVKKILYVISNVDKSLGFEWVVSGLKGSYDLTFVLMNPGDSSLRRFLKANDISIVDIPYRGKKDLPWALLKMCRLFLKVRPDVIHAHLFDATLTSLMAAWITRVKRRVYTRHTSTFHHLYFPHAVKYDKFCNWLATDIVSISQATDKVLIDMEHVPVDKLKRIPHGFDLNLFDHVDEARIEMIRKKWGIEQGHPCIGVIARHIEWKGIQYIIPAFKLLLEQHSGAILVLANAVGPYHGTILGLTKDIPAENIVFIPFEEDVAALYRVFDLYVHTPIDSTCEAFGQTYIEALASGIPSIFTRSGIAADVVEHEKNAWVVDFKKTDEILRAVHHLLNHPEITERLAQNGKQSVILRFGIHQMIDSLSNLYG